MKTAELNLMSIEELRDLNSRVVKMIKLKQQIEGQINLDNLEVGMVVQYTGSTSKLNDEKFVIKKIKKVNVLCESLVSGKLWNIKPANLKQAEENLTH